MLPARSMAHRMCRSRDSYCLKLYATRSWCHKPFGHCAKCHWNVNIPLAIVFSELTNSQLTFTIAKRWYNEELNHPNGTPLPAQKFSVKLSTRTEKFFNCFTNKVSTWSINSAALKKAKCQLMKWNRNICARRVLLAGCDSLTFPVCGDCRYHVTCDGTEKNLFRSKRRNENQAAWCHPKPLSPDILVPHLPFTRPEAIRFRVMHENCSM